jgi:hypothetical protein
VKPFGKLPFIARAILFCPLFEIEIFSGLKVFAKRDHPLFGGSSAARGVVR